VFIWEILAKLTQVSDVASGSLVFRACEFLFEQVKFIELHVLWACIQFKFLWRLLMISKYFMKLNKVKKYFVKLNLHISKENKTVSYFHKNWKYSKLISIFTLFSNGYFFYYKLSQVTINSLQYVNINFIPRNLIGKIMLNNIWWITWRKKQILHDVN
jgi:hypothetical protein